MRNTTKPEPRSIDAKGSPGSAQPIGGLSARGQKLIAPRPYVSRYAIEPSGAALERFARMKGSI